MELYDTYPSAIVARALAAEYPEFGIAEPNRNNLPAGSCCKMCGMPITEGFRESVIPSSNTDIALMARRDSPWVCKWCATIMPGAVVKLTQGRIPSRAPVKEKKQCKKCGKGIAKGEQAFSAKDLLNSGDIEYACKSNHVCGDCGPAVTYLLKDGIDGNKAIEMHGPLVGCVFTGGDSPGVRRVYQDNLLDVLEAPAPDGTPFVFTLVPNMGNNNSRHVAWMAPVNLSPRGWRLLWRPWPVATVEYGAMSRLITMLIGIHKEYDQSPAWTYNDGAVSGFIRRQCQAHQAVENGNAPDKTPKIIPPEIIAELGAYQPALLAFAGKCANLILHDKGGQK